jgi:hypothetical protein
MRKTKQEIMRGVNHDASPRPRLIGHNTIEFYFNGMRCIRYHRTTIIMWYGSKAHIFANGWTTKTTKDRINKYTNAGIYQKNYVWYMRNGEEFYDGVEV